MGREGGQGREKTSLGRADVRVTLHFYYRIQGTICTVQKIITLLFQLHLTALNYLNNVNTKVMPYRLNTPKQSINNLC